MILASVVTVRELIDTGALSYSITSFVNKIIKRKEKKLIAAEQERNDLNRYNLYKQAAIFGSEDAALELAQAHEEILERKFS